MRETGVNTLSESEWEIAKQRNDVIGSLAKLRVVPEYLAQEAAEQLGLTSRHVYELLRRYRQGSGLVTDMARISSDGGKGKSRITPEVELIISEVITSRYLSRQKPSKASISREIRMRCRQSGYAPPSYNTINARIDMFDPFLVTRKRQGGTAAKRLQPAAGHMPEMEGPLELVQIDHTKMDVIVVDEIAREPIGRPSLTLAIDVFSRCIVGMLLTLEPPSALSVGLCLTHVVTEKSAWLERRGLDTRIWPMYGKPKKIHVDNGPEFHSEALKRGCEQYGIGRDYRPKKQPHFGGIIERVIGTAMKMAHEIPGTTFSNIAERGSYKSEKRAALTLEELEKWLILAIGTYHGSVHRTLSETPSAVWDRSIKSHPVLQIADKQTFLIDFLPVIRRSIGRIGFVIDRISYYGDVLKPWISRRDELEKFIIRRDPRDLSKVWVLDPISRIYFDIPYRSISQPPITLWEHKKAIENLRKRGYEQVKESEIFRMVEQMREITETAAKKKKSARRDKKRIAHLGQTIDLPDSVFDESEDFTAVKPFDVEEWSDQVEIPVPDDEPIRKTRVKRFEVEEW